MYGKRSWNSRDFFGKGALNGQRQEGSFWEY